MTTNFFKETSELQNNYQKLVRTKQLSKKAMCDLCVPFRDKYKLTDLQTLRIARKQMELAELVSIAEKQKITGVWIVKKKQLAAVWCSQCDKASEETTPYCPYCGAKMHLEVLK